VSFQNSDCEIRRQILSIQLTVLIWILVLELLLAGAVLCKMMHQSLISPVFGIFDTDD